MSKRIDVNGVSFSYVPGALVLKDISIRFAPGMTAIIGENGAGKTTLMKLLNGLLKPMKGFVRVGSMDTREHLTSHIAKHVGVIFQNADDQIFKSKVIDEVMFGPLNIGMTQDMARKRALTALEELELAGVEEENPYDLSYSVRKRIGIAAILAMNTDVVIFDEPTIAHDRPGMKMIGRVMRRLRDEGKTVVAIAHDMDFVGEYFDRVVVMAHGEIVADGRPEDVFRETEVLREAHVSPPNLVKLGQAFNLSRSTLNVDQFAETYRRERLNAPPR